MYNYQYQTESKMGIGDTNRPHPAQTDLSRLVSTNPEAISRLISAAVVDPSFRKLLLSKPEKAILSGYNGELFDLTEFDRAMLCSIQANSLPDFAAKMIRLRENNSSGDWVLGKNQVEQGYYHHAVPSQHSWEPARL
jgi:hypothetical protein